MDKKFRALLISQIVMMYMSLAYILLSMFFVIYAEDSNSLILTLFYCGLGCSIFAVGTAIAIIVISAKNIRRDMIKDVSFLVMILKIVAIPWFIGNFVSCGAMVLGMLNIFLILFSPFFLCYVVAQTYLFIISTSLANFGYVFAKKRKRELKFNKNIVISLIFQFCECIDFIGAIILYKELNKDTKEVQIDVQQK